MKFLPLLISLTIISPNIYSNPSGADDEDIMDALIELPIHLYRINDIFSQSGNEVITDIKINSSVDDFGDEVVTETKKFYFLIDVEGVEEEAEVRAFCAEVIKGFESSFPFSVYLKFKKDLDFSRVRIPEVLVKYKLGNGDKGEFTYSQTSPSRYGVEKYRHFHTHVTSSIFGFSPTYAMFQRLRKDSSLNNGEIKLSFPTRSGSNILVSFNPFHESWIELYIDECRDKGETAKKLEKIMESSMTEDAIKAIVAERAAERAKDLAEPEEFAAPSWLDDIDDVECDSNSLDIDICEAMKSLPDVEF